VFNTVEHLHCSTKYLVEQLLCVKTIITKQQNYFVFKYLM